jgi:osmotically-inducible protein OsmY
MNRFKTFAIVAAMTAGLAASGCSVIRGQSSAGQYADDVAITAKVKAELLDSKQVDGLDVNVDSTNGKVTLSGWASSPAEAARAVAIASKVDGVKSVNNELKIKK